MVEKESLGDRLKRIEQATVGERAPAGQPMIARLDGRNFHTFTAGLARPYDERLSRAMRETAMHLLEEFQPLVAYTQSDEITLVWTSEMPNSQRAAPKEHPFDGKLQKLASLLAASASVFFNKRCAQLIPERANESPTLDCRVWPVENEHEAFLNLLWRRNDAIKNSISMAAQSVFPHKQLHGVSGPDKIAMLAKEGVDYNVMPAWFREGSFFERSMTIKKLTDDELSTIPEKYRAEATSALRSVVTEFFPFNEASPQTRIFERVKTKPKLVVDLDELQRLVDQLRKLESVDLVDVAWFKDGKQVKVNSDDVEKFKFIGLNNRDFANAHLLKTPPEAL